MRIVDVAHLKARALTRKTAGAERRETALMRKLGQRIVLIHELRELRRTEEFLDCGDDGTDVDERLRRDDIDVLNRHAFLDDALHTRKSNAELVLQKFADRAHAPIAKMVDVVRRAETVHEIQQIIDGRHDIVAGNRTMIVRQRARAEHLHALAVAVLRAHEENGRLIRTEKRIFLLRRDLIEHRLIDDDIRRDDDLARLCIHDRLREHLAKEPPLPAELLRQFVAADHREIIPLGIEEKAVEELLCVVNRRRFTGTQTLIDLDERFFLGIGAVTL